MKITMNHAKNLVTRELNTYKKVNEFVPFRSEVISQCNLITGHEYDEKGNCLIDFNDNYKQLINEFFNANYREVNQTVDFLSSYKDITLFRVAREIERSLEQLKLTLDDSLKNEEFYKAYINTVIESTYYAKCEPLDTNTLILIFRTNKNLILQNIDNVRKNWEEVAIDNEVDFEEKIEVAIDYYMINYISDNIHKEIEEYKSFMESLLLQLENEQDIDFNDFE